jgi:hypothetical protein
LTFSLISPISLDNLIATSQALPLIVVMDSGYTISIPAGTARRPELMQQVSQAFGALLGGCATLARDMLCAAWYENAIP